VLNDEVLMENVSLSCVHSSV